MTKIKPSIDPRLAACDAAITMTRQIPDADLFLPRSGGLRASRGAILICIKSAV
ncbi:hypothetical protein [Hoeflea ulvae]|uniref:Uncharacterized protein n=1 Tax=Hoeflea ulvae TaxID=2983764 RepID=A0ABT3YLK7_9HYPH|nr:hypothetical protein [Hoeflea ulvae]MCY0096771.1 hypothetical protein [Hoeflea ulvae]